MCTNMYKYEGKVLDMCQFYIRKHFGTLISHGVSHMINNYVIEILLLRETIACS